MEWHCEAWRGAILFGMVRAERPVWLGQAWRGLVRRRRGGARQELEGFGGAWYGGLWMRWLWNNPQPPFSALRNARGWAEFRLRLSCRLKFRANKFALTCDYKFELETIPERKRPIRKWIAHIH